MKAFTLGRVIPLVEVGAADSTERGFRAQDITAAELPLLDTRHRPLRDLRISVTDRCNFRCVYCMPKEVFGKDYAFLPRRELLSFEEIERVARVFVDLGVEKFDSRVESHCLERTLNILSSGWLDCERLRAQMST